MSQVDTTDYYPDSVIRSRLYIVAGTGAGIYARGLSYQGFVWYRDQDMTPLHFYDDGKGYLQMDKLGNGYVVYQKLLLGTVPMG